MYHRIPHNVSAEKLFTLEMEWLQFKFPHKNDVTQKKNDVKFSKMLRGVDHMVCCGISIILD